MSKCLVFQLKYIIQYTKNIYANVKCINVVFITFWKTEILITDNRCDLYIRATATLSKDVTSVDDRDNDVMSINRWKKSLLSLVVF